MRVEPAPKQGDGKKEKSDLDRMQGSWRIASAEASGRPVPAEAYKAVRLVIEGEQLKWQGFAGGGPPACKLKLEPTAKPKEFDAIAEEGDRGLSLQGIYKFDGDRLVLSFTNAGRQRRPNSFVTFEGATWLVYVLERDKK